MMVRSRDHRSAGLWWSLPLSGGGLGGHGRFLKSFQPLIITFCFSWCCRGLLCDEVPPMEDFLVFSALISPPPSSAIAGAAAADHFVTEFAVDRWVIHRGPLGGVENQPPPFFLGFG
uniref:Uncharacterized protein n=1 Tax=Fagus sylvatica TaxID=28930 RepID=A0A2N9J2I0_FAGSY